MADRQRIEMRRAVFERIEMIRSDTIITYSLANGIEFRTITTQYATALDALQAMDRAIVLCLTKGFRKYG